MNWFKKAIVMDRLKIWDEIVIELKEELGRIPSTSEVQKRLLQRYWRSTDEYDNFDTGTSELT